MQAFGHGRAEDMDALDALAIAKAARPETKKGGKADDLAGLKPGDDVKVAPMGIDETICPAVAGEILRLDAQEIAIAREDGQLGEVAVHFPRAGYRVEKM